MTLAGKRIGLLTASASRLGGGVFEAVVRQAALIEALGGRAVVVALDDPFAAADRARFGTATVRHARTLGPRQIGYAPTLGARLDQEKLDLLHLHGIWMYPSHAGARWARRTGKPYLISPHGMLDPWILARGRAKKRLARWGYERRSWSKATSFHALTGDEAADIACETGRTEVPIIANGAPPVGSPRVGGDGVLYLGRIHPKKNLPALIDGWSMAETRGQTLTIAGWGAAADVADIVARADAAGPSVRFVGPVHGGSKQALLGTARWLILPSLSEGLPMVALEAWAAGTPTIMTPACHLPEGVAAGAALPCGDDPRSIATALTGALAMADAEWRRRSAAARTLADERFGAVVVTARWAEIYGTLLA